MTEDQKEDLPAVISRSLDPSVATERQQLLTKLRAFADPSELHLNGSTEAASYLRDHLDKEGLSSDEDYVQEEGIPTQRAFKTAHELRDWWNSAFATADVSFSELEWYRLVSCWRVSREIARAVGIISDDELLSEGLLKRKDSRDPWTMFCGRAWIPGSHAINEEAILRRVVPSNLGIGPPPPPRDWIDTSGFVIKGYNPEVDEGLSSFIELVEYVSSRLQIFQGSKKYPELGIFGLRGVTDCRLIRLLWPSRWQMFAFEQQLVEEGLEHLSQSGGVRTLRTKMKEKYGFKSGELKAIASAAGREAIQLSAVEDIETSRAMMVLRLEELAARAREDLDLRTELMTLKALAVIRGITRAEPEDSAVAFAKAVAKVAGASNMGGRRSITAHDGTRLIDAKVVSSEPR